MANEVETNLEMDGSLCQLLVWEKE